VERSNRNFRKFFPKGTDFSKISQEELQAVTDKIRNTPLKLLAFRTPIETVDKFMRDKLAA